MFLKYYLLNVLNKSILARQNIYDQIKIVRCHLSYIFSASYSCTWIQIFLFGNNISMITINVNYFRIFGVVVKEKIKKPSLVACVFPSPGHPKVKKYFWVHLSASI